MERDRRNALVLSILTAVYNVLEALLSILASVQSGSEALFGFGLDSIVESLSASVVVWRFWRHGIDVQDKATARAERRATFFAAISLVVLGVYVTVEACLALLARERTEPNFIGLSIAIASIVVMPILFLAKYRLGKRIGSASLVADSKETLACMILSIALLVGLAANYLFELWWADAAAALVIAGLILREGFETLHPSWRSAF